MDVSRDIERDLSESPFESSVAWKGGALAGLAATVVMGAALTVIDPRIVSESIAGLYGVSGSLAAGWVAHLAHGTLFGIVFAVLLSDPGLYLVREWLWKSVVAGLVYGLVLAVVGAGIIMPIWLSAVGFSSPPSIPHVTETLLIWHAVYGIVLGALFSLAGREVPV